jgi:hypothetical protein
MALCQIRLQRFVLAPLRSCVAERWNITVTSIANCAAPLIVFVFVVVPVLSF